MYDVILAKIYFTLLIKPLNSHCFHSTTLHLKENINKSVASILLLNHTLPFRFIELLPTIMQDTGNEEGNDVNFPH